MAAKKKYREGAKRVSYFMPVGLKAAIKERADASEDMTETDIVHAALREFLKKTPASSTAFG